LPKKVDGGREQKGEQIGEIDQRYEEIVKLTEPWSGSSPADP
jgi:hypothetical protein